MKLTLILLLLTSIAHAGTLENRRTGETIDFSLNRQHKILSIDSMSNYTISGNYPMQSIQPSDERVDLLAGNKYMSEFYESIDIPQDDGGFVIMTILLPPINIPRLGAIAYDAVMLPFKAPIGLMQSIRNNKDHQKLMRAITGNKTVKVSNARFKRIGDLLTNTFIN